MNQQPSLFDNQPMFCVRTLNYKEIREGHRFKGFSTETEWRTTRGRMTRQEAESFVRFKEDFCKGYAGKYEIIIKD